MASASSRVIVEELVLGLQRARVGALLQVGTVAAVLRGDLVAGLGVGADDARQRRAAAARCRGRAVARSMSLNSDAVRGLDLAALRASEVSRDVVAPGSDLGDVRAVAAGLGDDVAAGLGVLAEHPAVVGRGLEQLARLRRGHLVRGDVVGDRRAAGLRRSRPSASSPVAASTPAGTISSTYGPYRPTRTTMPSPIGIVEISRASISPRSSTRSRRPSPASASSPK